MEKIVEQHRKLMKKISDKLDERRMSIDRFFAGKNKAGAKKWVTKPIKKKKPHKIITHQHDDEDEQHTHTTDHAFKKHSK